MLDYLKDIVKHVNGLGIETIKITGDDGNVSIDGIDGDKSIIVKGQLKKEVKDLNGVCGLDRLDLLEKIIKFYDQKDDVLTVTRTEKTFNVESRDDNGEVITDSNGDVVTEEKTEDIIDQLIFFRPNPKVQNNYRVIDRRMIPSQHTLKITPDWDIEFQPTKNAIDMFSSQASIGVDEYFGFVTSVDDEDGKNKLYAQMGQAGNEALLEFHNNISDDAEFKKSWMWPIDHVLKILKLGENGAETKISLLDKGLLKITLDTGLASYDYILPAKSR